MFSLPGGALVEGTWLGEALPELPGYLSSVWPLLRRRQRKTGLAMGMRCCGIPLSSETWLLIVLHQGQCVLVRVGRVAEGWDMLGTAWCVFESQTTVVPKDYYCTGAMLV